MDFIDLNNYIKPELLVLIPVLLTIGKFLKESLINSKHIPLILTAVGVVFSCGYLCVVAGENFAHALITGAIQGVLLAGTTVCGHQIFKQYTCGDK